MVHDDITKAKLNELEADKAQSILVHDLKNPIGGIHSLADLIMEGAPHLPKKTRQLVEVIRQSSKKALDMIQGMLTRDRLESGFHVVDWRVIDLVALLSGLGESLQVQWLDTRKTFHLSLSQAACDNKLSGDRNLIYPIPKLSQISSTRRLTSSLI